MSIIHVFLRRLLDRYVPGTGRRRAVPRTAAPVTAPGLEAPVTAAAPWPPAPRSPYGLDGPLDGTATAMVRPYVAAVERERGRQYRRRLALVLAADFGIDLDCHVVGAGAAA